MDHYVAESASNDVQEIHSETERRKEKKTYRSNDAIQIGAQLRQPTFDVRVVAPRPGQTNYFGGSEVGRSVACARTTKKGWPFWLLFVTYRVIYRNRVEPFSFRDKGVDILNIPKYA